MEKGSTLQITLVSGACCMPHLSRSDSELEKNIRQAVNQVGVEVEIKTVSLNYVLGDEQCLNARQRGQVLALFQKHGVRMAPAVLIGDQVRFAGGVPTAEQLREACLVAIEARL